MDFEEFWTKETGPSHFTGIPTPKDLAQAAWDKALEVSKDNDRKALEAAVTAIYFDDSSDYKSALWEIVKVLGGKEAVDLLESNDSAAYNKYRYSEETVLNNTNPSL